MRHLFVLQVVLVLLLLSLMLSLSDNGDDDDGDMVIAGGDYFEIFLSYCSCSCYIVYDDDGDDDGIDVGVDVDNNSL